MSQGAIDFDIDGLEGHKPFGKEELQIEDLLFKVLNSHNTGTYTKKSPDSSDENTERIKDGLNKSSDSSDDSNKSSDSANSDTMLKNSSSQYYTSVITDRIKDEDDEEEKNQANTRLFTIK